MKVARGDMRPCLEAAELELLNTDAQGVSEFAVTTPTNDYMPLSRYRIRDLVKRRKRSYWTSSVVHGRAADSFTTAEGRRVTTSQVDQRRGDLPGIAITNSARARDANDWGALCPIQRRLQQRSLATCDVA